MVRSWSCRLAVLSLLTAAGCRAGGTGNLAARPDSLAPRPAMSAQVVIDKYNANAEKIRSLEARPNISVTANGSTGGLHGKMALEMPRNFDLEMSSTVKDWAKIGSNEEGFWFWVSERKDPAIYVCSYEDLKATNLTATMQPEWIIEALGLRPITEREAATIAATPGERAGTTWLTQRRKGDNGDVLTKRMLVDERGLVLEHQLYAGEMKTLLSRAIIQDYKSVPLAPASGSGDTTVAQETAVIPHKFKLEWIQEKLKLEVTMANLKLNPKFSNDRREAIFTEPTIPGTDRVDLAKVSPKAPAASARATEPPAYQRRITRPAPPTGGGIQLQEPEPLGVEGAARTPRDPIALSADLNDVPSARDRIVRPDIPTAGPR